MSDEVSRLVVSSGDRVMRRDITDDDSPTASRWELSDALPGTRTVNIWQIFNKIWLALVISEDGHYNILRSINSQKYVLVHEHESEIYNIFFVDDGHALFCASDGWWVTSNAGLSWSELVLGALVPKARSVAVVALRDNLWSLVAYGDDHKLYQSNYPDGSWVVTYDTTIIWSDKWYPAIAGGPAGILAGAGNKLLRSEGVGEEGSWRVVQEVQGIIKSTVVSNQSRSPVFLLTIEPLTGDADTIYLTYDLGDSLMPDVNRVGAITSVQSVIPTGTNTRSTSFAVLGRRVPGGATQYSIIEGEEQ